MSISNHFLETTFSSTASMSFADNRITYPVSEYICFFYRPNCSRRVANEYLILKGCFPIRPHTIGGWTVLRAKSKPIVGHHLELNEHCAEWITTKYNHGAAGSSPNHVERENWKLLLLAVLRHWETSARSKIDELEFVIIMEIIFEN